MGELVLADTSVWIDLFGRSPREGLNAENLKRIATCLPVVQEVLQGISNDIVHQRVRAGILALPRLSDPVPADTYFEAADLYRSGRRRGLTIRSSVDCLIAAIAIRAGVAIWHYDRDFELIAKYTDLRTVKSLSK